MNDNVLPAPKHWEFCGSERATKSADEDADDLVSIKNIEQYSVPIAMTQSPKKSNTRNRET